MVVAYSLNSSTGKADGENNYLNADSEETVFLPSFMPGAFRLTPHESTLTDLSKYAQISTHHGLVLINKFIDTGTSGYSTLPPSTVPARTSSGLDSIVDFKRWIKQRSEMRTIITSNFVSRPEQSSSDDSTIIGGGGSAKETYLPWVLDALSNINPDAAERIKELRRLEPGWDGYGAPPPTPEATQVTATLLLAVHTLAHGVLDDPFVAPLSDGGLELEWEFESGNELMLVISAEGTEIKYLLDETTPSGELIESEGLMPGDLSLSELIGRVV